MNYKSKISSYVVGGEYKGHQWLIRKGLFGFLGYIKLTDRDVTILANGVPLTNNPTYFSQVCSRALKVNGRVTYLGDLGCSGDTWVGFGDCLDRRYAQLYYTKLMCRIAIDSLHKTISEKCSRKLMRFRELRGLHRKSPLTTAMANRQDKDI